MSARIIGFLLAFSNFVLLQAHAATDNHHATHHPHATHTAKQYAAHQTGHHSSVAHKGKQFLKLVLGIVIGCVVGTLLLCVCCCLIFRHRKNRSTRDATQMESTMPVISAPISAQIQDPPLPQTGEAASYYHGGEAPKYGYSGDQQNVGYQGYQNYGGAPPPGPPPPAHMGFR
ncbi:hypothetical protein EYR38_008321 [Pleurotus pulmonarius]|nr:hypothetical protein EYR38_008321 [Pleurotus pulmonarius]